MRAPVRRRPFWALIRAVTIMLRARRYPPFYDSTPLGTYRKILDGIFRVPPHCTFKAKDILGRLLVPNRARRLGKPGKRFSTWSGLLLFRPAREPHSTGSPWSSQCGVAVAVGGGARKQTTNFAGWVPTQSSGGARACRLTTRCS